MRLHPAVVVALLVTACGDDSVPRSASSVGSDRVTTSASSGGAGAPAATGDPVRRSRAAANGSADADVEAVADRRGAVGSGSPPTAAPPALAAGALVAGEFAADSTSDLVARATHAGHRERGLLVEELAKRHPAERDALLALLAGGDRLVIEIVGDALTRCQDADRAAAAALEARAADAELPAELRELLLRAAGLLVLGTTPSPDDVRASMQDAKRHVRTGAVLWMDRNRHQIAAFKPELEELMRKEGSTSLGRRAQSALESIPRAPTAAEIQEAVDENTRLRAVGLAKKRELAGLPSDPVAATMVVKVRTWRGGAYETLPAESVALAADEPIEVIVTVTGLAVPTALDRGGPFPDPTVTAFRYGADGVLAATAAEVVVARSFRGLDYRAERAESGWRLSFPEPAERRRKRVDAIAAEMRRAPEIAALLDSRPESDPKVAALRALWDSQIRVNAAGRYQVRVTHPSIGTDSGATKVFDLTIRASD